MPRAAHSEARKHNIIAYNDKKSNQRNICVVKVKKASKAKLLTKEPMDKAVQHIASEIVAAKPGLDGRTPRGFAEKLLKEAKYSFPKSTMNKVNYAVKSLKNELKRGSLSLNNTSNISCDDKSVKSTASSSTNTIATTSNLSNSLLAVEAEATKSSERQSNAKYKRASAAEAEVNAKDNRSKKTTGLAELLEM